MLFGLLMNTSSPIIDEKVFATSSVSIFIFQSIILELWARAFLNKENFSKSTIRAKPSISKILSLLIYPYSKNYSLQLSCRSSLSDL